MPKIKYDKEIIELQGGATAKDLVDKLNLRDPHQSIAASLNGVTVDLTHSLNEGDDVKLWHFEDAEGKEIFWHTSAHVLAQAVLRLWPDAVPTIGPPIKNGFYYDFANLQISEEDFPKIEKEIKKILSENFKPELHLFKNREEALNAFGNNPFKKELIEGFEEGSPITAYRQGESLIYAAAPTCQISEKLRLLNSSKPLEPTGEETATTKC